MPLHCAVTFQNHKNVVTWWWCRELTLMFKTLRVRGWKVWDTWKIDCDTVTQRHYDCDTDTKELTVTSSEQLTVKFPVQWSRPDEKVNWACHCHCSNMSKPHKCDMLTGDKWQLTIDIDVWCSMFTWKIDCEQWTVNCEVVHCALWVHCDWSRPGLGDRTWPKPVHGMKAADNLQPCSQANSTLKCPRSKVQESTCHIWWFHDSMLTFTSHHVNHIVFVWTLTLGPWAWALDSVRLAADWLSDFRIRKPASKETHK